MGSLSYVCFELLMVLPTPGDPQLWVVPLEAGVPPKALLSTRIEGRDHVMDGDALRVPASQLRILSQT